MADPLIELDLNRMPLGPSPALTELADRLLDLVTRVDPGHASIDTAGFRQSVESWRTALRREVDPWKLEALVPRITADCERFFAQVRGYQHARDTELDEIVGVLRDVLTTLRGGAAAFDREFEQSASTFAGLAAIEDIRELRHALTREVETLKGLVAARQATEDAAYRTLSRRVEELEASLSDARDEAAKDALTGLANRRSFDRALSRCLARAARGEFAFTLAMIDIDDFKKINDAHGHPIGDRVLMCVATVLSTGVRTNDLVARYGGEEFAILLEQAEVAQAREKLQQLIDGVAQSYEYEYDGQPRSVAFSFSIGATDYRLGDTGDTMTKRADDALYQAKRKGKKRLEVSPSPLLKRIFG